MAATEAPATEAATTEAVVLSRCAAHLSRAFQLIAFVFFIQSFAPQRQKYQAQTRQNK